MVKIACQTIVFSASPLRNNLEELAGTIKKAGYDGIETGHAYFTGDKIEFYKTLFEKLDLKLAALHTGWDIRKDTAAQFEGIKNAVAIGRKMDCPCLYLSGGFREDRTREEFLAEAENYREIGKLCNGEGLKFCYHNHHWEFLNNGEGMKILLDNVSSELMKLVPDVGWLEISGVPSVSFLRENINRVEALHFKDFKGPGQFTELGNGIVPFKEIYDYLLSTGRDWWISAEQDRTELDPKEAARLNYEYVAGLGK